jgi:hypothetical protein
MKERGILFSAPMVRALLAGKKTQTRRAVKAEASVIVGDLLGQPKWYLDSDPDRAIRCPYGVPGDRLWVRETWRTSYNHEAAAAAGFSDTHIGPCFEYAADHENPGKGWRPSIFMIRGASRILLEVTDVRVQCLQDISEEDAKAEGVAGDPSECAIIGRDALARGEDGCGDCDPCCGSKRIYRPAYERLWDEINGAGSWASNPWVWAISFKRVTP